MSEKSIRFIADAMLGRLAKWLRLLGYDTLYFPDIEDGELLRRAMREERVILTRDSHFQKRKNVPRLFMVRMNNPIDQLMEVTKAFGLAELKPGRCSRCNGVLQTVDRKEEVQDLVPEYVFFRIQTFHRCDDCGAVYWEGTHLGRFRKMLEPGRSDRMGP